VCVLARDLTGALTDTGAECCHASGTHEAGARISHRLKGSDCALSPGLTCRARLQDYDAWRRGKHAAGSGRGRRRGPGGGTAGRAGRAGRPRQVPCAEGCAEAPQESSSGVSHGHKWQAEDRPLSAKPIQWYQLFGSACSSRAWPYGKMDSRPAVLGRAQRRAGRDAGVLRAGAAKPQQTCAGGKLGVCGRRLTQVQRVHSGAARRGGWAGRRAERRGCQFKSFNLAWMKTHAKTHALMKTLHQV